MPVTVELSCSRIRSSVFQQLSDKSVKQAADKQMHDRPDAMELDNFFSRTDRRLPKVRSVQATYFGSNLLGKNC